MGRKAIYTPEERKSRDKELRKIRDKKQSEKIKNDPIAKAKANLKNAKYLAKIPQEEKREKWRKAKQAQREREKQPSKVNTIPCKTDFINQFKENHQKIVCEIAGEQKN